VADRLRRCRDGGVEAQQQRLRALVEELRAGPIAVQPEAANEQHYELPAAFFERVLGRHLKYSCGLWTPEVRTLDEAEEAMLALYVERAGLADGQEVLELGCGWGSLSLYLAARFPHSRITAVSNSHSQRRFVEDRAERRGLSNLRVLTADMNDFRLEETFDRILSIEMFEHMKNYGRLMQRVAAMLRPEGRLFVHVFSHREHAYHFEAEGAGEWMARHFFTGGTMPSDELLAWFQEDLVLHDRWRVDGTHYQRTAEAWLERMDRNREALLPILASVYPGDRSLLWWTRWRLFFMACAELFGYRGGQEWMVSHYLFRHRLPQGAARA
jgi:cyclopropane-fatty-acyl-phospholipid synthase